MISTSNDATKLNRLVLYELRCTEHVTGYEKIAMMMAPIHMDFINVNFKHNPCYDKAECWIS